MEIDEEGSPRWEPDLEAVIGGNIRRLREARGLSQRQLCAELVLHGLSWHQTTLSKVEAGDKPLRVNEAAALASYFDVPVESLWDEPELQAAQDEVQMSIIRERNLRMAEERERRQLERARDNQAIAERRISEIRQQLKAEWLRQEAAKVRYRNLLRERDRRAGERRGQHREAQ
ncbi:helix-turn-helix domain-containing protein [Quadrisphaera sp. GCM10027208]